MKYSEALRQGSILWIHPLAILVFTILAFAVGNSWTETGGFSVATAVVLGGMLSFINVAGTAFAWPRILDKKSVALPVGIIVSKFALSIGVLYWLTRPLAFDRFNNWLIAQYPDLFGSFAATGVEPGGSSTGLATLIAFSVGLASVLPAVLVAGFWHQGGRLENQPKNLPES